jgi:acyl-coenzyme A thioesterase PaaI-like protein
LIVQSPGTFAAVSALEPREAGSFAAEISEEWTIAGKPNGGYLLAMLGRAAAAVGEHPHPVTASAVYLRSPVPGPARVEAEVLRAGRSATQVRVRLNQEGTPCVEALVTTAQLEDADPHWVGELPAMGDAPYEECVRLVPQTPSGDRVAMMEHAEVRLDPGSTGFLSGRPSGRGELRGWLALPHGEAFDPCSLLLAVDAFPPATFDVEHAGWVPTLELTAYVRALPAPGPVRVLVRAQLVAGRRVDESCYVWDRNGRLVAHSNQLAGIRLG